MPTAYRHRNFCCLVVVLCDAFRAAFAWYRALRALEVWGNTWCRDLVPVFCIFSTCDILLGVNCFWLLDKTTGFLPLFCLTLLHPSPSASPASLIWGSVLFWFFRSECCLP